jgi:cellulose synthase/poly-beta-1,6-N-acetylglucosamine synthase-like glycosyltransferase
MTLLLFLLLFCGLPLFLRAAVFLSQSVCPPSPRRVPAAAESPAAERLAVCPVCDDLNEAALRSVLAAAQDWGRVVVAEDGNEEGRMKNEEWEAAGAIVFRRGTRSGWKAGNVNAVLAAHGEGVREFVIMDADTVAPAGFFATLSGRLHEMGWGEAPAEPILEGEGGAEPLRKEVRASEGEVRVRQEEEGALEGEVRVRREPHPTGFIQARVEWNASQPGALPRWMGPSVGLHFRTSMRARAARGFTMFHGHAAMVRMEAYRDAGGLPEIVSEDLGFTLRLRARGWRGVYADDVVAYEDFPPTVAAWRKRQDKWLRGTLECLRKEAGPFLKAQHVPLREKLDMLLNAAWLYLSPLALIWFAGLALLQPALMAEVRQPAPLIKAPAWELVPDLWHWLEGVRLTVLWSWPVCAVMLFMMLAPLVPAIAAWQEDRKSRRSMTTENCAQSTPSWTAGAVLRFWIAGSYLWLSSLVAETLSILSGLLTGRARFDNTGASRRSAGVRIYHANHPLVHVAEAGTGAWFLERAWTLANPWLAVPGFALLTAPLAVRPGWECRPVRWLALLPLLTGLAMVALTVRELLR